MIDREQGVGVKACNMLRRLKPLAYRLAQSDILFWTLLAIMVLLTVGTIAQKTAGLYQAQEAYFSSFVTFIGPVPFPGGYTLMSILFVNLLMKFLFFSEWHWPKAGILLTHFGVLLLLFGGFVTATTQNEGYITIAEGKTSSTVEDYHQRMMMILKNDKPIQQIPYEALKPGLKINSDAMTITLNDTCYNCMIEGRTDPAGWQGPGRFMDLKPTVQNKQDEMNLTGIEFTVYGTDQDGKYLTFDKFPKPPELKSGGNTYTVMIGRRLSKLPFELTLNKFSVEFYPGTQDAKAYKSDVTVRDGADTWPVRIEMNQPLRLKGFTLYQSSFDFSGENPVTVLNVVENKGRIFPYISSIIIGFGLILHMILRRVK